jgi:hypothetical protein
MTSAPARRGVVRTLGQRSLVLWEILRALVPLTFIELSLRNTDLRTTCRRLRLAVDLDSAEPPATTPVVLSGQPRRAARATALLVRHWPAGDTCLRRCLLLGHRLRDLGPVLRIGVLRKPDGGFAAHSWLELDGATFDPGAADFAVLGAAGPVAR